MSSRVVEKYFPFNMAVSSRPVYEDVKNTKNEQLLGP